MNKKVIVIVAAIVVAVLILAAVAGGVLLFIGLKFADGDSPISFDVGNKEKTVIVYEADKENPTDDEMNTVVKIIENRLDKLGYAEFDVAKNGNNQITVEITKLTQPDRVTGILGQIGKVEFEDADGNVVLSGEDIEKAVRKHGPIDETNVDTEYVEIHLTKRGVEKFTMATQDAASRPEGENYIAITLDGIPVSTPMVDPSYAGTGITSDVAVITGDFSVEEAQELASVISAGHFPFGLNLISTDVYTD